jgi:hypothetical protein
MSNFTVEFTGPAPYSQHANNVPRPSAYAMKEVEHLGLQQGWALPSVSQNKHFAEHGTSQN